MLIPRHLTNFFVGTICDNYLLIDSIAKKIGTELLHSGNNLIRKEKPLIFRKGNEDSMSKEYVLNLLLDFEHKRIYVQNFREVKDSADEALLIRNGVKKPQ